MRVRVPMMIAATLGVAALGGTVLPASAEDAPSFQAFEKATYVDVDGQYVVNGDEPVSSKGELNEFYKSMVSTPKHVEEGELVVQTIKGGVDDKWSATQARNLTYCVSDGFGTDKAGIVTAMQQGAGLWEAESTAVDFTYVPAQDASCNTSNKNVIFSVEPVESTQYIARAFFPSDSKRVRNVLVDDSIFSSGDWEPADIMAHELGHVLGFRHEHVRPEAGVCFEKGTWRELTPYDSASIMHYPQCGGSSEDLEFQDSDGVGLRALYGS